MDTNEKVTVDKSYFDALLRRYVESYMSFIGNYFTHKS
jgi:hypothetical protein